MNNKEKLAQTKLFNELRDGYDKLRKEFDDVVRQLSS